MRVANALKTLLYCMRSVEQTHPSFRKGLFLAYYSKVGPLIKSRLAPDN
jgi:hypothetical protein